MAVARTHALVPADESHTAWVVARLVALSAAVAVSAGVLGGIVLALVAATLHIH